MAEEALPNEPVPAVINAVGAPTLCIDTCSNYGFFDGMGNMTLANIVRTAMTGGGVRADVVVVAHIRFGLAAARELRDTLDKIILLASPLDGQAAH